MSEGNEYEDSLTYVVMFEDGAERVYERVNVAFHTDQVLREANVKPSDDGSSNSDKSGCIECDDEFERFK